MNTLKNWIESLMKHFHKHPIEGRWTLVSREGQLTPHEAVREFGKTSYRWTDNGRTNREESGSYTITKYWLHTQPADGRESEIFDVSIHGDQLTIQQLMPVQGRVTVYRRTK